MGFTVQQEVQCCYSLAVFKFPVTVQRKFRQEYGQDPPERHSIVAWHKELLETGSVLRREGSGNRAVAPDRVEVIHEAFQRSPRKSIRRASRELRIPRSTVHDAVHKRLRFRAYKIQVVQKLRENDKPVRHTFALQMLSRLDDDVAFMKHVVFSHEGTFHVSGKVNRHSCRILGNENPHEVMEHERDIPKLNVWCALTSDSVIGPFFSEEATVTGASYLKMLQHYAITRIPQWYFFQQESLHIMPTQLKPFSISSFQANGLGEGHTAWSPRSSDLTTLDFFIRGYIKDLVYQTKVHVAELRSRKTAACEIVTPVMLQNTWREVEYRLDICRATKGAHVEIN
jgi:hypothetical protein